MVRSERPPALFLMGPTGAGKTACALWLAQRFPLEIVSVDSALVYRGLDIGTAKPDPGIRRAIAHHLIDICDPAEAYSAARFRTDALAAIAAIHARGRLPLLVGGTGLYFRVLQAGIAALPAADAALRARLQADQQALGCPALHGRLARLDPASAARIHPNDPQRILRALEIVELTGRPMSALLAEAQAAPLLHPVTKWVIAPQDRSLLHARLAARFGAMLERGLVNEVIKLRERTDLSLDRPALRAVGYRAVWRYLAGELDHAGMVETALAATRQLAKRQYTWFRAEAGATWLDALAPDLLERLAIGLKSQQIHSIVDYT